MLSTRGSWNAATVSHFSLSVADVSAWAAFGGGPANLGASGSSPSPSMAPLPRALQQLMSVANERFTGQRVTLPGPMKVQKRLAEMAYKRGLEIGCERQR